MSCPALSYIDNEGDAVSILTEGDWKIAEEYGCDLRGSTSTLRIKIAHAPDQSQRDSHCTEHNVTRGLVSRGMRESVVSRGMTATGEALKWQKVQLT